LDNINKITTDNNLKNYLSSKSPIYLANTNVTYNQGVSLLDEANASLAIAEGDKNIFNATNASDDASACLKKVAESLDNMYKALENSIIADQAVLDAHKANISAQITYVNAAINVVAADRQAFDSATLAYDTNVSAATNNLNQAEVALSDAVLAAQNYLASINIAGDQKISAAGNSVDTAGQTYDVAQKQLTQLIAPARSEDLSLAQAKVNDAQSVLDLAKKQVDDSTIKSPIDGQVIRDNYEIGEQISGAAPVYSVLAENNFEISVDISESDVAKVKIGDAVEITLDSFGPDTKFNGTVYFIEPASTVIQDVIYYKVKIKFTDSAEILAGIKPGMTANITIITDKKENVLTLAERAVIEKSNGEKIVRVLSGGKITEVPVKTGLRGDDGLVEILAGNLKEGETIILLINTK
jgi:HlyD family secretion protein